MNFGRGFSFVHEFATGMLGGATPVSHPKVLSLPPLVSQTFQYKKGGDFGGLWLIPSNRC